MLKIIPLFKKNLIVCAALCGIFNPAKAHIHRIEHWSRGDQSLYLVHDYHVSSHPNNKICDQQQLDLIEAAKQHSAFVVTEDMSVYNNKAFFTDPYNYNPNVPAAHSHRKKHPATRPPIVGLTVRCQDQKIPVHNIEFRQAGVASRNGEKRIPAQLTLAISDKVRDEIKNYNDEPILNNYYQEEVALYDRNISNASPIFEPIRNSNKSLKEVLPYLEWCNGADSIIVSSTHFNKSSAIIWGKDSRLNMATDLYDMRLINARAMHLTYLNKNKSCIFICLGSEHLRQMKPIYKQIGYECKGVVGESYITKHGTSVEPDAINVTQAFETLPKPKVKLRTAEQTSSNNYLMIFLAIALLILLMFFSKKKPTNKIKTAAAMLFFFASILTQSSLNGYIYCVDVLESPKYKTKIILLSDRHELNSQNEMQQKKELASWIKETKVRTAIEDGGSYTLKKRGVYISDELNKSLRQKSILVGLDKEIGSHLVTNIDKRSLVYPKLDGHIFWGIESIADCKTNILNLREEKYTNSLNTYKNDILSELKKNIIPKCESLFATINNGEDSISNRIQAVQYDDSWDYMIQSHIARVNNVKVNTVKLEALTSEAKIKDIMTTYDASLLDAAACNFINQALQEKMPVVCIALGGVHIETLVHPLTDKRMGFIRKTMSGKALVEAAKDCFKPAQNLYKTLKGICYPSLLRRYENTIILAGSALLGLCIGNMFGSNHNLFTQVGLTAGTFLGTVAGYNLIKSGWTSLLNRYNCSNY